VAPLVSVGVGFHPELSGRENVYVNGTILGLSRSEIDRRFDAIVDFAQIERFIDTPVKFYSSGMFVRLGFAVAVQADPDVLLVDEVLAVGDLAFQLKCFDHMMSVRASGTTIVVVSHNLNAVRRMCTRTVVLHGGEVRFDGDTADGISLFHELLGEPRDPDAPEPPDSKVRSGVAEIESFTLLGADGAPSAHVATGDDLCFRAQVRLDGAVDDPAFAFNISTQQGLPVYTENTFFKRSGHFDAGERLELEVRVRARLVTGSFSATVGVTDADVNQLARSRPLLFYVAGRKGVTGAADLEAGFDVRRLER
jgi:ABC-2 type transport system ATP-binding protein